MNQWISTYFKTVNHLFPIMGTPERTYVKRLRTQMEEFFQAQPPASLEDIAVIFGRPEDAVNGYLASADPEYLVRRMKRARLWRTGAVCSLVLLLFAVVLFACHMWWEYYNYIQFMDNSIDYWVETIE